MARIEVGGSIGSLIDFYKHEAHIFGRCPHCGEPFRLSEVKLTYGKEPPRDLLVRMKRERDRLQEKLEDLESEIENVESEHEEKLSALQESHEEQIDTLDMRWSDKFDNEVEKRLHGKEREIRRQAIARSRAGQLGKTLEKIAPMFPGFGHYPYDVRPIFDPIDFVVFDGYFQGHVRDVVFIEFKTGQSRLNAVQSSIRDAVDKKRVHFEERRLSKEALRMLEQNKGPKLKQLVE